MENKILPSSSGCYGNDSCGARLGKKTSRPVDLPEFSWPPESRLKENGPLLGTTAEENTRESTVNQSKCAKVVSLGDRFQSDQFSYQNHVEGSKLTCGKKSQANEFVKTNQCHPLRIQQLQSIQHQHPLWKSGNLYIEKSQYPTYQKDLFLGNPVVTSMMPLEMHNVSSGFVREIVAVGNSSCALEQNLQCPNSFGSNNPSSRDFLSSGVSTSTEQKVGGVQGFNGSSDNCVENLLETSGRSHVEGDLKMKDQEAIDKQTIKSSLTDDLSSKDGYCPPNGVESNSNRSSHRLDEKSGVPSKQMPLAAEKLWDGSLQLNSSVTVSVVAFFKSGEKLLDLKWSESVEVKGKVRLDAFEKYIKDLPRTRNRPLMVISLCFKEGSSEKGLKGMKEVVKGYTKGKRVGFAQLSPDVVLYLCPRSDAIITILAKHGFFKGMAAVEGSSELMIGCVVWKKNRTTLTSSVAKRSGNSLPEQLQQSPSDSTALQAAVQSSVENSKPPTPLDSEQADVTDDKESGLPSSHIWGNLVSSEASCVHHQSNAEAPKESRDLPKAVAPVLSHASKPKIVSDDEDLPEFDFGTAASGMSSSSSYFSHKRLQLSGSRVPDMSKRQATMSRVPVALTVSSSGSSMAPLNSLGKNIFCDDDMPEWLPPDAQNVKSYEAPGTFTPESRKFPPLPAASTPGLCRPPANSKVPPPIPSYLTGFTFNPVVRPESGSLAAGTCLQRPADKRVRRS